MAGKTHQLDIDEDLAFQRREWTVQHVGWWVLTLFVAAAALGLFGGGGPLSRARAGARDAPLSIEYERFIRINAPARLVVHYRPAASRHDAVELLIGQPYFEQLQIDHISPQPIDRAVGDSTAVLRFSPPPGGVEPLTVIFDVRPLRVGRQRAEFRAGGTIVAFTQFAYP